MYSFHFEKLIGGTPTSLQVVYANHEDNDKHLAVGLERLVEAYNRRLPPSRLLFVCPLGLESRIEVVFKTKHADFKGRLASITHIAVAPYDQHGKVLEDKVVRLTPFTDWDVCDSFVSSLADSAASEIFDNTKTILNAPHGYSFRKPSGREEDIFVRAGNMLRDSASLVVFNHLLLRKLPRHCDIIYIDSFTILSFALSLKSVIRHFGESNESLVVPTVENIHSYELSPGFRVPNESNYLVLISASTSGGLARKLVDERQADPKRILHLLGVGPSESDLKDSCVYFKARNPSGQEVHAVHQQNAVIEIGTEEFLIAQGRPRPVRITRSHVNAKGACELHKPFYLDTLKFQEPSPVANTAHSTFSVIGERSAESFSPVRFWICHTLIHELPASARTIVHLDDPMSKKVARWICCALGSHVAARSFSELKSSPLKRSDGSIVVVAYQDHDLERVRETNVALRNVIDAHRHFLVCFSFPSSGEEYKRLKDDLRMGPAGAQQFGWSEFLVLPVGADSLHESLVSDGQAFGEDEIGAYRSDLGENLADVLQARCDRSEIPSTGLFLPRVDGNHFSLRPGSIFFRDTSSVVTSQIAVYAMVAAAMQVARERNSTSSRDSNAGFDDNPFVRSVLDPGMFVRFNDGVLQASLLRASRQSELDYSASADLSRQFTSACHSVLVDCEHDVGDAALEFVHALVTKKISLRPMDRARLYQKIESNSVLRSVSRLLATEQGSSLGERTRKM